MPAERWRFRDIRNTSGFRRTVRIGGVFAIGIVALVGLVYFLTVRELDSRTDRILHFQAGRLLAVPADDLPARITAELARSSDFTHLALLSASGEKIAGDIAVDVVPKPHPPIDVESRLGPLRLMAIRTGRGETLLIARDISQIHHLRARILLILVSSSLIILIGIFGAAVLLALGPLRRVRGLELAAQEIARGRFETRMPILGRGDELDQIAGTVNLMVDEIGRVVAQVKGVTDAIAHDLRTPLAHVRAHLLALQRLPEAAPIADHAIEALDLVLARFQALLRIAELEAGARRAKFETVDLAALSVELADLYEPVAEERGVTLTVAVEGTPTIAGDHHLMLEAVSNLIDNAIKFARNAVTLSIDAEAIVVRDDGAGIPAEERQAVLRRFHRGANAEGVPGAGLGLSIVAAIAHLHGMELRLEDAAPGLAVTLARAK